MASKYDDYNYPSTSPDAAPGHPGNTDETQLAQVEQLRMMLEAEGFTKRLDTNTLLRFLRARRVQGKFNVQASKDMFVNTEKWRKETGLDDKIDTWTYPEKPEVFKYYPQYYHKIDKDGRPVYIEKLGKIDLNQLAKITTEDRMLTNLAIEYERCAYPRLPACSRKAGRLLETCCTVMDLKGVGITSIPSAYGYLKKASVLSQDYYPERLGKLYIVNAPWGFASVFGVVKGFLDPVTQAKINVFGSGYKDELLKQVPAENLPVEYGGTCECPGGCMLSDDGPWQSPEYQGPAFKSTAEAPADKVAEAVVEHAEAPLAPPAPDTTA